jgi:predicted dehydrogenase
VVIPRVEPQEPLRLELEDFAHAIRTGEEPRSNLALGIEIVAAIELAETSMRAGGKPLALPILDDRAAA